MSGDGPASRAQSTGSDPIPALGNLDSAPASAGPVPAPGARVVIRHAEWVIRRVDRAPDGGYQLVCDGVSELVREREAIFLTTLEPAIQVLDPADTRLVPDDLRPDAVARARTWVVERRRAFEERINES